MRRRTGLVLPLLAGLLVVVCWQAGVALSGTKVFPSPKDVFLGAGELFRRGLLVSYVLDSMGRVGTGFLAAALLGLPLGMVMGLHPGAATVLNPLVQVLRPISPLAWMPLAVVILGVGELAPISLIFLASFFPCAVAAADAVRGVPAIYLRAGRNFGLSRGRLLWRVVLPAALPHTVIGLRLALGIAWLVVVAAEMIAVDSGLGYLIVDARNAGKRYDLVVAGMLMAGLIGLLLDLAIRQTERLRSLRWGFGSG